MAWDDDLHGTAYEIAASEDKRLRVLAGPGTGKSFALKRLVARVLENQIAPSRIIVITFTRNSAADLREELHSLQVSGAEDIRAGTLHSFCFKVLIRAAMLEQYGRVPRPLIQVKKAGGYLGFEWDPLLNDINNEGIFGDKRARIKRTRAYEAAWARNQHDEAGIVRDPVDQQFEEALVQWLIFHRGMLIGELVPVTLQYFRENPLAPELSAFDRVIVDEYQDLNKAEQSIIDLLATRGKLMVVGDADQSIYSFRHANPNGVEDFSARHPSTIDKSLEICRRCPQDIVTAANRLISYNHIGDHKAHAMKALADNPRGEIHRVQWPTLSDEVSGIAGYVQHIVSQGQYGPGDILILCPRRKIGYQIRNNLKHLDVAAHSFFHEESLEEEEAQEAFTLLTLFCDREDRVSLRFWLGLHGADWRLPQYSRLRLHCEESGGSPYQVLEAMVSGVLPSKGFSALVKRFKELQERLAGLDGLLGQDLIDTLFPESASWADAFRDVLADSGIGEQCEHTGLLEYLREYITQPEVPTHPDFVRIMSLHGSKGLTSKITIVAGIVDSMIPYRDSDDTVVEAKERLREQRRLFYVAITRPRQILVLSSPVRIQREHAFSMGVMVNGNGATTPSRFIGELGLSGAAKSGVDWITSGYS